MECRFTNEINLMILILLYFSSKNYLKQIIKKLLISSSALAQKGYTHSSLSLLAGSSTFASKL